MRMREDSSCVSNVDSKALYQNTWISLKSGIHSLLRLERAKSLIGSAKGRWMLALSSFFRVGML